MKLILYICIWIAGISSPVKVETRTPFPDTFVRDYIKTGLMKEIQLTQGKVALVDDEDFEYLNQWKWCAHKLSKNVFQAMHYAGKSNRFRIISMHRVIMNPPSNLIVDHKDHNMLNNQKANLRICTRAQNMYNKLPLGKYKGAYYKKVGKNTYIVARIMYNYKTYHLGYFKTLEEAAHAYDKKAKELFGEFACLNFTM